MAVPVQALLAAVFLAFWPSAGQASTSRARDQVAPSAARVGRTVRGRSPARPAQATAKATSGPVSLARAQTLLAEVKRDPAKRRYRHHWEKAIHALERAARGRDAPVALFEAARARYGLYRFSAVEADRDEALSLGTRAAKAGSREAASFVKAVRLEAGDEEVPAKAPKVATKKRPPSPSAGAKAASAGAPSSSTKAEEEEESTDPLLDESVAETVGGSKDSKADERPVVPSGPAHVSEIKTWSNSDYTRVAIYLSKTANWQKEELLPEGERPRRLAIDLKSASLDGRASATPVGDAQVQRVRVAQYAPETVRVVLDLAGNDSYQIFRMDDPPRLIVDVGAREPQREAPIAVAPPPAPSPPTPFTSTPSPAPLPVAPPPVAPAPPVAAEPAQQPQVDSGEEPDRSESEGEDEEGVAPASRSIKRIVIDAGHGGHDTGAIGPTGVREKDVVLSMAKRLAQKLRHAGFEPILTRKDDVFLPLEERTAIANAAHGDLFVSLHANAFPRRDRKGIETYFLNVADGRYAARLAARENGTLSPEGEDDAQVLRILSDLNAKSSADASRQLARQVQRELCAGVRSRFGEVRDLGVKSALFYVLLGARMPAVLVETAFLSNRVEEGRLASARYQEEVAGDIARAVTSYAGRDPRVAAIR